MKLAKHLKKLEDKLESFLEPRGPRDSGSGPEQARSSEAPSESSGRGTSGTGTRPFPRHREPLELKRAILTCVEEEIRHVDGRPVFPFNRIDVVLWAADARNQAILEAELLDSDRLRKEIVRTLEAARVAPPRGLTVAARFVTDPTQMPEGAELHGFHLECSREHETEPMSRSALPPATLLVEQGDAEPMTLALEKPRTTLGRLAEVTDRLGRIVRRNDLAFKDAPGINATVSRMHAHIGYDPGRKEFRLFDDNSAEGTVVFRDGRRIDVPQGPRRGVALRDGDDVYLGRARIKFHRSPSSR